MSRPRYGWWGYVKDMIRRYPERKGMELSGTALAEQNAVRAAIEETKRMSNGRNRLRVIDLVLWQGTYQVPGAALQVPCSERTAAQWHGDFIKLVAENFKCDGLLEKRLHPRAKRV